MNFRIDSSGRMRLRLSDGEAKSLTPDPLTIRCAWQDTVFFQVSVSLSAETGSFAEIREENGLLVRLGSGEVAHLLAGETVSCASSDRSQCIEIEVDRFSR